MASLMMSMSSSDGVHWELDIPETRLSYIRCAARGIDLKYNKVRTKLSQLTDKLKALETELISLEAKD
jgi:hypothetical protein